MRLSASSSGGLAWNCGASASPRSSGYAPSSMTATSWSPPLAPRRCAPPPRRTTAPLYPGYEQRVARREALIRWLSAPPSEGGSPVDPRRRRHELRRRDRQPGEPGRPRPSKRPRTPGRSSRPPQAVTRPTRPTSNAVAKRRSRHSQSSDGEHRRCVSHGDRSWPVRPANRSCRSRRSATTCAARTRTSTACGCTSCSTTATGGTSRCPDGPSSATPCSHRLTAR